MHFLKNKEEIEERHAKNSVFLEYFGIMQWNQGEVRRMVFWLLTTKKLAIVCEKMVTR